MMLEMFRSSVSRKSWRLYPLMSIYAISQPRILRLSRIVIRFYNLLSLCPNTCFGLARGAWMPPPKSMIDAEKWSDW